MRLTEKDIKDIKNSPVKKEQEFYKKGGLSGKKNQKRNLKIHENGNISYWKDKEMKGDIKLNKDSKVYIDPKHSNRWHLETD